LADAVEHVLASVTDAPSAAPSSDAGTRRRAELVVASFTDPLPRAAVVWQDGIAEMAAALQLPDPPRARGPVHGWRLIAHNNRELARGFVLRSDRAAAAEDARAAAAAAADLDVRIVVAGRIRGAAWCAQLGERPVVVGARRYENRSAAREAAESTRRLLTALGRGRPAPERRG
jgi:hypothetical protein